METELDLSTLNTMSLADMRKHAHDGIYHGCPDSIVIDRLIGMISDKAIEAVGWAYADCCVTLDKGGDPRKTEMPDVLERVKNDLSL